MSERTTRLVAIVALSISLVSMAIAVYALRVSEDRTAEIERLRESLERAATAASSSGGRPSLALDPGDDRE